MTDKSNKIGVSIFVWVDTEAEAVNVVEKLATPITGFILEGHNVHLGRTDIDDGDD